MSGGQNDVSAGPIIIVKRRGGGEEGHHGGAWKIAYADFMTAMMAFFLVMWLVNAADKKTIVQVAAYFNPMHLTDRTKAKAGLEDQTEEPMSKDRKEKKLAEKEKEKQAKAEAKKDDAANHSKDKAAEKKPVEQHAVAADQALFDDPTSALEEIARAAKPQRARISSGSKGAELRDPFDLQVRNAKESARTSNKEASPQGQSKQPDMAKEKATKPKTANDTETTVPGQNMAQNTIESKGAKASQAGTASEMKSEDKVTAEKATAAKDLTDKIKAAVSTVSGATDQLEVKATPEGFLVSINDTVESGMFEVGSAKPKPETVLILEKIGNVLKTQAGPIVLRGHTDGRAYRNSGYDNWRLSSARAQMAYHMLTRGGVDETRVRGVEGRADRDLKVRTDKESAQNRRIEILIMDERK